MEIRERTSGLPNVALQVSAYRQVEIVVVGKGSGVKLEKGLND